jgi:two-component system, cell cycle sensor histidine kinase and response regulator CckA
VRRVQPFCRHAIEGVVLQDSDQSICFNGEAGGGKPPGAGTSHPAKPGPDDPQPAGAGGEFRYSETILLVEDEEAVRKLLRRILERAGYTILDARDGAEALSISAARQEPIHLLLTDVVMPEMSGPALADQITILRPEIKVLYISGYMDNEILRQNVLNPGKPFLSKPFSVAGVLRKVREVLDFPAPA